MENGVQGKQVASPGAIRQYENWFVLVIVNDVH